MKKNTIIQFIVTGMFLFGATACTGNFEDYNKNPHEPDQNDMGVDWYLVRSLALNLQDLMMPEQENFSQYVDCLMAGAFSGYVADSNLGTGWSGRYATYNPSDDWKKIPFNDFYSKFYPDYFNLKNQSDDELFLSLAELYRIVVMLRVTDTYGPIPYSKVGAANAIKSPYDSQQAVYAKMLEDLDNIITVLGKFGNQSFSSSADRIYNGNTSAWYKFANSLKLRMAMRTCYVAGFNVNGKTSQQLAEEAVAAGVMTAATDGAYRKVADHNPYGPIPYSKVGAANAIKSPYDSQQAVYAKMLEDLDNIITVLGKFGNQSFSSSADRIYNGNTSAWYKFANSLKLRMAMRTCYVAGFNVNGKTSQQLAEEAVAAGVMTAATDGAYRKVADHNPWQRFMVLWSDARISADLTCYMNAYNDPRREAYYDKSTFGTVSGNAYTGEESYVGLRRGILQGQYNSWSQGSSCMKVTTSDNIVVFRASEVAFLRAEGALRNWNMGGTAKDFYEEGIRLSFEENGITSGVENYLAST